MATLQMTDEFIDYFLDERSFNSEKDAKSYACAPLVSRLGKTKLLRKYKVVECGAVKGEGGTWNPHLRFEPKSTGWGWFAAGFLSTAFLGSLILILAKEKK